MIREKKKKLLVILAIMAAIYFYQNKKYEDKMIRHDACMTTCPRYGSERQQCLAGCREKYGVSAEMWLKWREIDY